LGWGCGDGKMLYCYLSEEQISPHMRSSCDCGGRNFNRRGRTNGFEGVRRDV
jgi:hypothetical protein